jgi:phosphopantetheinyl transferase (holo-ACP synthase)
MKGFKPAKPERSAVPVFLLHSKHPFTGCGIDVETVSRFAGWRSQSNPPPPLIFSRREAAHAMSAPNPAESLCVSFCFKESVVKAVGEMFDPTLCEFFWNDSLTKYHFSLHRSLRREYRIGKLYVCIDTSEKGLCVATVFLFQGQVFFHSAE